MCHTVRGFTRDQYCQVAAASQQDPTVKGLQSFANLTEGKIYCVWHAPHKEAIAAWFKKMNVPYDSITKIERKEPAAPSRRPEAPGARTAAPFIRPSPGGNNNSPPPLQAVERWGLDEAKRGERREVAGFPLVLGARVQTPLRNVESTAITTMELQPGA